MQIPFKIDIIALIGPLPPPSGGMANQTIQLSKLLEKDGIKVILVQVNPPYKPLWITRLRGVRALFRLVPYLLNLWRACGRCQLMHIMANSGWSWHLFTAPAVWIATLRGIPVVINYRGGEAENFFSNSFIWVKPTLKRASEIIVPSGFLEDVFRHRGFSTSIVPNIIDLSRFTPERDRQSPLIKAHFVVTRNLEDIYDIPTALRAFAIVNKKYPHSRLTVAGSGPLLKKLEKIVQDLGISTVTVFTGRLDNEKMAELYRKADIMLNPSLADNMPISILEALASGVPVISTDAGGIPYLVENEKNALIVPRGDFQAMASCSKRLLENVDLYERLRTEGILVIQKYTWHQVKPKLLSAYQSAIDSQEIR